MTNVSTTTYGHNPYQGIKFEDISRYGWHLGIGQGIKRTLSSILHGNPEYLEREMNAYEIEWHQVNEADTETVMRKAPAKELADIFVKLDAISTKGDWEGGKNLSIIEKYLKVKGLVSSKLGLEGRLDFDLFLKLYNEHNNLGRDCKRKHRKPERLANRYVQEYAKIDHSGIDIKGDLHDAALFSLLYQASTYANTALGISGPNGEVIANTIGCMSEIWKSANEDAFNYIHSSEWKTNPFVLIKVFCMGIINHIKSMWKDPNSFNPVLDLLLNGFILMAIWEITSEMEAFLCNPGDAFPMITGAMQSLLAAGFRKDVLNYTLMHLYFQIKSDWHRDNWGTQNMPKSIATAIVRGFVRNAMMSPSWIKSYGEDVWHDLYDGIPATLTPKFVELMVTWIVLVAYQWAWPSKGKVKEA